MGGTANRVLLSLFLCIVVASPAVHAEQPPATGSLPPRVIICTDIGGGDYDDFQSMVHLFVYADRFDIEGLISTAGGSTSRKEFINKVIDVYEKDFPNLRTWSKRYPTPDALRAVVRQGLIGGADINGLSQPTEGSKLIVEAARRSDPRPLWVLCWAGIEDLAQALHDDPSIKPKLRVYFIGGPNKEGSSARAYAYIARNFPDLWIIESDSAYYGWFVGGDQSGDLGNISFVTQHLLGQGALGNYFARGIWFRGTLKTNLKMGDTPSLAHLLGKYPDDPTKDSWGGRFVRAWDRAPKVFDRIPTQRDTIQTSSVAEIILHPAGDSKTAQVSLTSIDSSAKKQTLHGFSDKNGGWHFFVTYRMPNTWKYTIKSSDPKLDGQPLALISILPPPDQSPSAQYPNWWIDDPDPALIDTMHEGAKTVNRWRADYLHDFAKRIKRCAAPNPAASASPSTQP